MADVFVSYSRQDSAFVARLANEIESSGKNVWIDTAGIEDTEVFPLAIRSAIESSDAFLFVISPASVGSRFCEQEVDYALSLNKRLVPVLRIPVLDDELPDPIRERNWIPFEEEADFDQALARVLHALDADLAHRRSHTRWLTKAIEWDNEKRDKSLLLRGTELRTAELWFAGTTEASDPAPTILQREYVLASRQAAGRRSRVVVSSSLGVALLAVGLLVFALLARSQAVEERAQALSLQQSSSAQALALQSQDDLTVDPEMSVILAKLAVEQHATPETMLALRESLDASPLLASLPNVNLACGTGAPYRYATWPSLAFRPHTDELAEDACQLVFAKATTGKVTGKSLGADDIAGWGTQISYSPTGSHTAFAELSPGIAIANSQGLSATVSSPLPSVGAVDTVTWNPKGTMVGATADGSSMLLDVPSGIRTVLQGSIGDTSLTFTSDGRFAIVGTNSGVTQIFDMSGDLVHTLPTRGSQTYVAASPKAALLAVAVNTEAGNGLVEIWNTNTWMEEFVLTSALGDQFSGLAFSPDGTRLALAQANGSATVWSLLSRSEVVSLVGPAAAITSIVFSPDGAEVATAYGNGMARIWRANGPEGHDLYFGGSIESVALSGNRLSLASLGNRQDNEKVLVSEWRVGRVGLREIGHRFVIPGSSPGTIVSISPDGLYVADVKKTPCGPGVVECPDVLLHVFNVASGLPYGPAHPVEGAEALAWSDNDRQIAVASIDVQVITLGTGEAVALSVSAEAEQCGLNGAPAFSANDAFVAWATRCGNVGVFRVTGAQVASFSAPGEPSGVAFSADGEQLAVSSWGGGVGVWDLHTERQEFSLLTGSIGVTSVVYSPDGRFLISTLLDESAQVWNVWMDKTPQLQRVDRNSALLITPAFQPVGTEFATGDAAGSIKIWPECPACGDPAALLRLARRAMVTELTPLELAATRQ
jgi:WD40 repeat protein